MDFFIDNAVKNGINNIIRNKSKIKTNEEIWRQMTKCLIREKGLWEVIKVIEEINIELADADWFENKYPKGIFKEYKPRRTFKTNKPLLNRINTNLKITDVAKKYGLDTDKNGKTTCPFHLDNEPSLMLDDKRNIFHCFGCGVKGNLIKFIKMMEDEKIGRL